MVIYTYLTKELFFLNLLVKLAELFDGLVGLLTLGMIHPGTSYPLFIYLCKREFEVRCSKTKDKRTPQDTWPRKQIWPKMEKKP